MVGRVKSALVFGALLALSGCGEPPTQSVAPAVRPVKLVTITAAVQERDLSFPGVVRAVQSAELTFNTPGQVVELNVLEGAEVAAGAVIARLDQRDARNQLAQAEAEFENARSEYRRAESLVAQDAISRSVLDQRKTQMDVAQAAVDSVRKALEDTVIRAPFAGGISRVYVEAFQNVQAKEPIAVIQSDQTEALVNIPGTIIARIPQLAPVNTRVILDAAPDVEIPAVYREASGVADDATQTYQVRFSFTPPEGLLTLPGMTATVKSTLLFDQADDLLGKGFAVPIASILAEGAQRFVWVVDDAMQLHKREVTLGPALSETVTVISGLEGTETIAAAGVSFLSEGMTVRAWQAE